MKRKIIRTRERVSLMRYLVEQGGTARQFPSDERMPSGRSLWMMRNAGLLRTRALNPRAKTSTLVLSITKSGRAWLERGA